MGFRFRKTFGLGSGLRVILGKSGAGRWLYAARGNGTLKHNGTSMALKAASS
jgi:hypothetical protein